MGQGGILGPEQARQVHGQGIRQQGVGQEQVQGSGIKQILVRVQGHGKVQQRYSHFTKLDS